MGAHRRAPFSNIGVVVDVLRVRRAPDFWCDANARSSTVHASRRAARAGGVAHARRAAGRPDDTDVCGRPRERLAPLRQSPTARPRRRLRRAAHRPAPCVPSALYSTEQYCTILFNTRTCASTTR